MSALHLRASARRLVDHARLWRDGIAALPDLARIPQEVDLILPVTSWVIQADVQRTEKVSIVLPTRNRQTLLARAVRSVLEQTYDNWELMVVDDRSTDGTSTYLNSLDDNRIFVIEGKGVGSAAARNVALDNASGGLIAYIDDDNTMTPHWLKAVVWASERWPEADVVYGARIIEHRDQLVGLMPTDMPQTHFRSFNRRKLEKANFIDLGVVAHRIGANDIRFDENLGPLDDWDFILRLTESRHVLALPVVASFYGTSASSRQSESNRAHQEYEDVRARLRQSRGGAPKC